MRDPKPTTSGDRPASPETSLLAGDPGLVAVCDAPPAPDCRLIALRLIGPKSPQEKDALLRQAIRQERRAER